jgi:hypothetical protein
LAGGLCKFYAIAAEKWPTQRQPLLVQYMQQAYLLFIKLLYTPLVISGNDKNKQLTLLKNVKKWHRPLFRPKTNHTCHQKPNPSQIQKHQNLDFTFFLFPQSE